MKRIPVRFFLQTYVLLVLLSATMLSPLPYSVTALVWLLVMLPATLRPLSPKLSLTTSVATLFLVPLVLEPILNYLTYTAGLSPALVPVMAVTATLPTLYLLDYSLKQNSANTGPVTIEKPKRRHTTIISRTLFTSAPAILLIALILTDDTLLFTSLIFILYLLALLIRIFLALPRMPLELPPLRKRVMAGTTVNIPLTMTSKASLKLYSLIRPADPWVKITPPRFTLDRDRVKLNLTLTPKLSGSSRPQLRLSVLDPWGLIQVNQPLAPVELYVIPRAKYAEWLAMRYLEQTGTAATAMAAPPSKAFFLPRRGIEYFDSRTYQPGDPLKNIDWKHTLKLNRLIVKEYIEAGGLAAILTVNLSVTDSEAADKLAFNLITAALTLAQEAVPTALAAYNHQNVVLTTVAIEPREILKITLRLVKDIAPVEFTPHFLQRHDSISLRRDIKLLKHTTSAPAQRLLNMLNFEYQAMEKAARNHPASLAISLVTEHTPAPAIIVLVSQLNHDAEALPIVTEKLMKRGFTTLYLDRSTGAKSRQALSKALPLSPH